MENAAQYEAKNSSAYQQLHSFLFRSGACGYCGRSDAAAGAATSGSGAEKHETPDVGAATDRVVALFDEIGFEPVARTSSTGTVIDLNRCPFAHLAQAYPEIACSVHLGLMRGALDSLGAPVRAHRLEPFVTPTLCRVHLRGD